MPHPTSIFSKHGRSGRKHASRETTGRQRNRLKKTQPIYSGRNVVSYDLSKLMGNHHSIEDVPRPTRPPRPSTSDIPDLPSLPIYKTFASEFRPTALLSGKPNLRGENPSESVTGWVLANSGPSHLEEHATRRPALESRTQSELPPARAQIPPRPQYDRASRLAESYQSLLPDLDSMDYPDAHSTLRRQRSDQKLRSRWDQDSRRNSISQSSVHGNHAASCPGTAPATPRPDFWQSAPAVAPPPPPPQVQHPYSPQTQRSFGGTYTGRTASVFTDTSSTVVESDNGPVDMFSITSDLFGPSHPPATVTHFMGSNGHHSKSNDTFRPKTRQCHNRCNTKKDALLPSFSDTASSTRSPSPSKDTTHLTSSDYVGLQICSELLTDELINAFFHQHANEKHRLAPKLQVLLLIEAYEAMLESCRRELLNVSVLRSQSSRKDRERAQRRRHIKDAVRILDHWLDSLYVIYDDTFGDVNGDGASHYGGDTEDVVQDRIGDKVEGEDSEYTVGLERRFIGDMGVAF